MSQRKLGRLLDRTHDFITRIEQGRQFPDFPTILDIIKLTGGNPDKVVLQVVSEAEKLTNKSEEK